MEKKTDFKGMSGKEKIAYIWDYYKWWMIIGVIIICAVVSTIRHFVTYQEAVADLVLVNTQAMNRDADEEPDFTDFMEHYGYDTKKEKVTVADSYVINLDDASTENAYAYQAFFTLNAAGSMDVVAADREVFEFFGRQSDVVDLKNYLSEDIIEKYEDKLVYVEDAETGEEKLVGIDATDTEWMQTYNYYAGDCVIGIASGTVRGETAERLLCYLLGEL